MTSEPFEKVCNAFAWSYLVSLVTGGCWFIIECYCPVCYITTTVTVWACGVVGILGRTLIDICLFLLYYLSVILVNILTLCLTLLLSPFLVPIYLIDGELPFSPSDQVFFKLQKLSYL